MLIIPCIQMEMILCEFVAMSFNILYMLSCALSQAIAKWVHPETGAFLYIFARASIPVAIYKHTHIHTRARAPAKILLIYVSQRISIFVA